jgi:hypothetical protein
MKRWIVFLLVFVVRSYADNTAERALPAFYVPGGTVDVTISVTTDAVNPPNGIIVSESLPAGWQVIDAKPNYSTYRSEDNTYVWLVFTSGGVLPFSVGYTASVPSDVEGLCEFSGMIKFSIAGTSEMVERTTGGGRFVVEEGSGLGDINGSGNIDISDVILCLRMAIGLDTPVLETADVNGDGVVDISDVIMILRLAVGT